jgi:hypothetical protein
MNAIEQNLANWHEGLVSVIPVAGLLSRNPVAYKWKALFRGWMLREAVFWRMMEQLERWVEVNDAELEATMRRGE